MDPVDRLARKLIAAFEPLEEELILEEIAIPEHPQDPEGTVELWVASGIQYSEEVIVRGWVEVPTRLVLCRNVWELSSFFREQLLGSREFEEASRVATIVSRANNGAGVPDPEEAELN